MRDVIIIGGGIVGLAVTHALLREAQHGRQHVRVLVLEKEAQVGVHQSGHNSGVIHSGIYYRPGSLKARLAREGNRRMVEFCRERGIPCEVCGKVIVAADKRELPGLQDLLERGRQNGLEVHWVDEDELREIEPYVRGVAAVHVATTGIIDYRQVCEALAAEIRALGGDILFGHAVTGLAERSDGVVVQTRTASGGTEHRAHLVVNCAGLFSDRIARMAGVDTGVRIVPFRGEYYELAPERRHLVRNLIYPVPDPNFPFLGVHFTRMIDGRVEIGPNAVLAFRREGYSRWDLDLRDMCETLAYAGFRRLARTYWREGLRELARSYSKRLFLQSAQRLLPDLRDEDLRPAPAGVRAQALSKDGRLVDDFAVVRSGRMVHVCNAPSPAATASLCIGEYVVREYLGDLLA
jgi:L-2-hydroxyglutarate oxidase